jgi:hypothetical protein
MKRFLPFHSLALAFVILAPVILRAEWTEWDLIGDGPIEYRLNHQKPYGNSQQVYYQFRNTAGETVTFEFTFYYRESDNSIGETSSSYTLRPGGTHSTGGAWFYMGAGSQVRVRVQVKNRR